MKYNGAGLQSDKPIININNANLIFSKNHYFINKWVPSLKYPDFLILCIFFHLRVLKTKTKFNGYCIYEFFAKNNRPIFYQEYVVNLPQKGRNK